MTTVDETTENALGEFLRARRAELKPENVGLPGSKHARRVPGLRREEVAQLAGISADYYNRLEQGRLVASWPVLAAIGRSLQLDTDQMNYLQRLFQPGANAVVSKSRRKATQTIGPQTQRLLTNLKDSAVFVLGRYMDILAWNDLAAALYFDFSALPAEHRNLIWLAFLDADIRSRYMDWETNARECVAYLRMDVARYPNDARLTALVGELSIQDVDFRKWWAAHQVALPTFGQKKIRHPKAGELTMDWQILVCAEDTEQSLLVMSVQEGAPSYDSFLSLKGSCPANSSTT